MSEVVEEVPKAGAEGTKPQRMYSGEEVETILRDRLKRVKREPESDALVADLRTKYDQQVQATKDLTERWERSRQQSLRSTVQAHLAEAGCLEPELLADTFLSRKVVKLDDSDNMVVSNANNNLGDLIRDTLASKPHLVRAGGPGLGSKAPKVPESDPTDPSQMTKEQLLAALGGTKKKNMWQK